MRTFSATIVTAAGLILALIEFATGATELPGLLGEDTYAIIAFVLGAVGVVCTFIIRGQIVPPAQHKTEPVASEQESEQSDES